SNLTQLIIFILLGGGFARSPPTFFPKNRCFLPFLPKFPQIITTFAPFFEEDIISQKEQTNTFLSI
ncbi:MAG: hypothetical protein U0K28_01315, partial [Prevotellamassilia sp.]|nr:hypothetical protein [Prevotellamassilia sp.]